MAAVGILPAPAQRKTSPKLPSSVAGVLTPGWTSLTSSSHPICRDTIWQNDDGNGTLSLWRQLTY